MQNCLWFGRAIHTFLVHLNASHVHFLRATEIVLALLFTAKTPAFSALLGGEVFPLTRRFGCSQFGFHRYV